MNKLCFIRSEQNILNEKHSFQSIKERLELHTAKRDEELCQQTPIKLSKKEKKKQKESKKLAKQKKMDADKVRNVEEKIASFAFPIINAWFYFISQDADESEINSSDKSKEKKKKKKFLF